MTRLNFEKIRKHNELREQCRKIAETFNNSFVWNDYFNACTIEQMIEFIEKYI